MSPAGYVWTMVACAFLAATATYTPGAVIFAIIFFAIFIAMVLHG